MSTLIVRRSIYHHRTLVPLDHPDASISTAKLQDDSVDTAKLAPSAVTNTEVAAGAAVAEAKLALNYATHSNVNDPTTNEKAALAGTSGTAPSGTNKFVDNTDARNTNSRAPTAHASTHSSAGSDPVTVANLNGNLTQARSHDSPDTDTATSALHHTIGAGANQVVAGNDSRLTNARTPTSHASTHVPNGSDPIDWAGTINMQGLASARPAAGATNTGAFYYATDTNGGTLYRSTGSAWEQQGQGVTESYLAAGYVTNAMVNAGAAIVESKLSLNFATHSNANDPTANEKAAMAGTSGTAPSGTNKFVDNTDSRMTNSRTPTAHASSHSSGGSDPITVSNLAGNLTQARSHDSPDTDTGTSSLHHTIGTSATQAAAGNHTHTGLSPAAHASTHYAGATDPIDWAGTINLKGVVGSRPAAAAGNAGYYYYATDVNGGTLYRSTGAAWDQVSQGVTESYLAAGYVTNAMVAAGAAIVESKLSLNFATHSNANDPSSGQKSALAGTTGTPGVGNEYVTTSDTRMTNARTPSAHASSHSSGGSDPVSLANLTGTISNSQVASRTIEQDKLAASAFAMADVYCNQL